MKGEVKIEYMKKIKPSVFISILAGLIMGLLLFFLGYFDDAPGLSLIGIILGTGLIFFGIHHASKQLKIVIIAPFFYGIFGLFTALILFIDGEFEHSFYLLFIWIFICIGILGFGIFKLLNAKKIKQKSH
jgi:hypothetical protein